MKYKAATANKGCCMMNKNGCNRCGAKKQSSYDWLSDIRDIAGGASVVEVQFKNTRKGYFQNPKNMDLYKGDLIVVEAQNGYDIGEVTLTGKLVELAMKRHRIRSEVSSLPRLLRRPTEEDLTRWHEAQRREEETMIQARQIASSLALDMKIGDVEYQGDGNKAIFYYIADGRVDFRQLIRVFADTFKVRIEMKQIGARQEAGRIGGIGPCGRELCCASWVSSFVSVNTNAARIQDLSPNPQKLTGLCSKLKCCMNYEVQAYAEAHNKVPHRDVQLQTKAGTYYFFKADYLQRLVSYSTVPGRPEGLITIPARRAYEIINLNKTGVSPDTLTHDEASLAPEQHSSDILSDNSLTRFDNKKKGGRRSGKRSAGSSSSPDPRRKERSEGSLEANYDRQRTRRRGKGRSTSTPKEQSSHKEGKGGGAPLCKESR